MRRILNALRICFLVLFNGTLARQVDELLKRRGAAADESPAPSKTPVALKRPRRRNRSAARP